jgi:anaerobic sulfite reductase subunit C
MRIPKEIIETILAQGERESPNEACGYLIGTAGEVKKAIPMTNVDRSSEHFSLDPREQFAAMRQARTEGLEILAVYHTHPASPARPSAEDIRLAYDPAIVYVIVSLVSGKREAKAFRIRQGTVTSETLVLEEKDARMAEPVFDLAAYKKVGMIQQRQKEYFAMRLRAVGGDLTAKQIRKIAEVAERYGRGGVHLSTRQGVEIHYVHHLDLEKARAELASENVSMGACGPRVRVIVACPGSATCRWGIIDTKEIARELDSRYFGQETPHKFKMAVTGCPHNCAKATENDIGVMGAILPKWQGQACTDCGLCAHTCPTKAIERQEKVVDGVTRHACRLDEDKCINCSICTSSCPVNDWVPAVTGCNLFIGGTMGKVPRLATLLKKLIRDKQELFALIEKSLQYYRQNGRKRERFGHMIDRIGVGKVKEEILNE